MAAVSLCFPINFLMVAIGGGLAIAGSVLIAQYKGRGEERAMNHVTAQTLIMVLASSIVLTTLGYVFSEPIMRFMGAQPDVLPDAVRFMQITFIGFIFVFGFFVYQSLMRGLGVVQMPMLIVLLTVILNFALDPLFIFGWGPIPRDGRGGRGDGDARRRRRSRRRLALRCCSAASTGCGRGWPTFGPTGTSSARRSSSACRLGRASDAGAEHDADDAAGARASARSPVAAYGIGIRILTFVVIPAMGLAMATTTLVAQNLGAGKLERAEQTTLIASLMSFLIPTVGGVFLFIFAMPLATFFVPKSPAAIAESAHFIRIISLALGCIGLQHTLTGTLRGAGNTLAAMVLTIVSAWVIQFPLAYVLSRHTSLGIDGIWWSHPIAMIVSAVVSLVWFLGGDWKRTKLLEDIGARTEGARRSAD